MRSNRTIAVLDKFLRNEKGFRQPGLAVGHIFVFPSGRRYQVAPSGAILRVDRKPWNNKAERKQHLRARRLARQNV